MRKSKFTQEQIAYALRQAEQGTPVTELCRKMGVSEQTFYTWRKKFAEMGIVEMRRVKQLEEENRRLQEPGRRAHPRQACAAGGPAKKRLTPAALRARVEWIVGAFRLSKQRACKLVGMARSSFYWRSRAKDQTPLRRRLRELAAARPRFGYPRLHVLLRREGWHVNIKRVYRLYKLEGLGVERRKRKKRGSVLRVVPEAPTAPNQRWSMDFVQDSLLDGKKFRVLTVVDVFTRECLALHADFSLTGRKVAAVLDGVGATRGYPTQITVDNGTEFYSKAMDAWAWHRGVKLDFIRPGRPMENGYIESFNGRLRDECLNVERFSDLLDARAKLGAWRQDYNENRPHGSIGNLTPVKFASRCEADGGRIEARSSA